MHIKYQEKLGYKADFLVRYSFYPENAGGRKMIPYQGYRSDFFYDHPVHYNTNQIFMIWPEFLDNDGEVILENNSSVSTEGIAQMWIIFPERRAYHKEKIQKGMKGFFMEGSRRVAECEIIEILYLHENPCESPK